MFCKIQQSNLTYLVGKEFESVSEMRAYLKRNIERCDLGHTYAEK
jgi:hypothetical protein